MAPVSTDPTPNSAAASATNVNCAREIPMKITHFRHVARAFLRLAMAAAALLCTGAAAQSRSDGRQPSEPLGLKAQGSFFVGGRAVFNEAGGLKLERPVGPGSVGDRTC